jgi:hypothetical protein
MKTLTALLAMVMALTLQAQDQVFIPAHYSEDGVYIPGHYEQTGQPYDPSRPAESRSTPVGRYGGSPIYSATLNWEAADQQIAANMRAQQQRQRSPEEIRYRAMMKARRDATRATRKAQMDARRTKMEAERYDRRMKRGLKRATKSGPSVTEP